MELSNYVVYGLVDKTKQNTFHEITANPRTYLEHSPLVHGFGADTPAQIFGTLTTTVHGFGAGRNGGRSGG